MENAIAKLGLRAKVAQLVVPSVFGDGRNLDQATELARAGVGGFVLYEGASPRQTAEITRTLREDSLRALPDSLDADERQALGLFISCDQENGAGQVVKGATELPPAMAFAATNSAELMYQGALLAGREGRSMGFDLNYAPSADFTAPATGPVESGRTFGSDTGRAKMLFEAYARGYHEAGMFVSAKHFPGRGSVRPGPEQPWWCVIDKTPETVEAEDWAFFSLAIEAGVDFVMSEHIAVPSVTGDDLPASVSRALITGRLREKLGFRGVITTDDLWYDEVCARFGPEEVAVLSLEAGHDTLLKPRDPLATIDYVLAAIESGRLTEARIDESLARLLAFKRRFAGRPAIDPDQAVAVAGSAEHAAVCQRIADASVVALANDGATLPLTPARVAEARSILLVNVARRRADTMPAAVEEKVRARFAGKSIASFTITTDDDNDPAVFAPILAEAAKADLVLLSFSVMRNRMGDPAPLGLVREFLVDLTSRCRAIALSHGNPFIVPALPGLAAGLSSWGEGGWFGNRFVTIDSMLRIVTGELAPAGTLPLAVGPLPIGHGLTWSV